MTSEIEAIKTNEFLRRRKLRLQQVREQSKDIAKKIRQRAKVEKNRQVSDLDAKKQKEYFECQDKLVKQLQVLYTRGIENVGVGHQSASELTELTKQDEVNKTDVSKLRGKEAAAILRRNKQEKLDQQKKLLDRKLQAREIANEISRDKSSLVANKLLSKFSKVKDCNDLASKAGDSSELVSSKQDNKVAGKIENETEPVKTSDMATQWDMENIPHEWEPTVPELSIPIDKDSPNDFDDNGNKTEKNKRIDLFAVSEEMPSSLRGSNLLDTREREPGRPSLTIVSEYLQNRKMRLRETEPSNINKKSSDDMQSLRQTILRTRTTKPEGSNKGACPSDKVKTSQEASGLQRKNSVMMYNHSTRDTRDLPYCDDKFVVRDLQAAEDAYSQAMKEVSASGSKSKEQNKKQQDIRNKVAVTKQNVEKEYKDTMNFLNSLPKDKQSKPIKNAYMDEHRQQIQYENRQQKMQQEYKKIQKECKKHHCQKNRNLSKSPMGRDLDVNYVNRDFQYSWMPVPESDGNLAIHAIPNTVKPLKHGNSVKFSTMDSYHEYRSRHKHTPPTKDTNQNNAPKTSVIIDRDDSEYSDSSSLTSDTSSVENLRIGPKKKRKNAKEINKNLSDAERIIVYKVLDSKSERKTKRQTKLLNEIAKSLSCIGKTQKTVCEDESQQYKKLVAEGSSKSIESGISFEQLNEGVYKMVEEKGDNVAAMYFHDRQECDKAPETQSNTENVNIEPCGCRSTNNIPQTDKDTGLPGESGDSQQPKPTSNENQDPSPSPSKKQPHKPSTISTCSYNTAMNDKTGTSEGGYIKLIDEAGQDAGKFFIGPSGFLNNNAYEVVIQLRKKDGTIEEKKLDKDNFFVNKQPASETISRTEVKNISTTSNMTAKDPQPASSEVMHDDLDSRSVTDQHSTTVLLQPSVSSKTASSEKSHEPNDKIESLHHETNTEADEEIFLIHSGTNKNMCDKGVHTQHTTTDDTKQDGMSRPATSTYTQTSLSSPLYRPVFYHMSSSTSTAYMSPPEFILPKFLKPDCIMTDDEPLHTIELTAKEYCEEYTDCSCKKCMQARNVILRKIPGQPTHNIKTKYVNKNMTTPPNSTITVSEIRREDVEIMKQRNIPCKSSTTDRTKCLHKTRRHVEPVKKHCNRNKRKTSVESVHSITTARAGVNPASKNRHKPTGGSKDKKSDKSNLNPIIRDYVNKLLALNRDGLKAVEVADQECSSVGTPGSSIINVPYNIDKKKASLLKTISLEQIKSLLKKQIEQEELTKNLKYMQNSLVYSVANNKNNMKSLTRPLRKKPVHKVKSLNISRNLAKRKSMEEKSSKPVLQSSTDGNLKSRVGFHSPKKVRSKSSPTPRQVNNPEPISRCNDSESTAKNSTGTEKSDDNCKKKSVNSKWVRPRGKKLPSNRATLTDSTVESISESTVDFQRYPNSTHIPVSMSTQTTNMELNTDSNLMKLAEDKLHNMEKIADLTEKCTKRLSDLARVLQEVRKNKSLVYNQISSAESTDSQADHKSEKSPVSPIPIVFDSNDIAKEIDVQLPDPVEGKENVTGNKVPPPEYIEVLSDIPKPQESKHVTQYIEPLDPALQLSTNTSELLVKNRPKPPPALSRLSFKHGHDYVIPHELSTVIEVDSPMSVKHKNHSARNNDKEASNNNSNRSSAGDNVAVDDHKKNRSKKGSIMNPDLLQTNSQLSNKYKIKLSSTESSDESKFQMIDLKQFNEIMLEPFISIQEYAKQYNMEPPDEGSNLEEIQREDPINDDISSLHSDGSLPDVIAELLKRNIIAEPFKFDTASNVNSTTISSESTLSMLALSKARRGSKKKPSAISQNKENIGETSDTLSISSNPDLENAFKKLGMGWASSTLKKTKERLALSSSSNTSSSSLSQFKMKSFNQEIPVLVTDSVSSVVNMSKGVQNMSAVDYSKNAEQQTTLSNSMTVKEFLRNELAKKITFTNKSNVNTSQEFVSLFETKMPEEMKENSQVNRDERSMESAPSGVNRARTSTPVQLFKSMTYHSSSSSNVSNGLFSNVDDLSSVKMTSNSMKNHSTSDKDDLTIPNFSLRLKKSSDCSKSD
ncbi:uncharacterized protein LOC111351765 isoform X2 [Spodoptera litura]|uniref:Uncharacterized protein LOC111351765 isoform X2 n=1 Tax=Spodoptera litura TaxID=69820 RepID=A0A9J7E0K4_SPOLT|nr:uncharacterized protein LOC111351765 isoform X2 [Spodoptera litura]